MEFKKNNGEHNVNIEVWGIHKHTLQPCYFLDFKNKYM